MKNVQILTRKLTERGRSLGVTLDCKFCQRHRLKAGDQVEQFEHPTNRDVLCIRVKRRADRPNPARKVFAKTLTSKRPARRGFIRPKSG